MSIKPPAILCIIHAQLERDGDQLQWLGDVEHVQTGRRLRFFTSDELLRQISCCLEEELRQLEVEPIRLAALPEE